MPDLYLTAHPFIEPRSRGFSRSVKALTAGDGAPIFLPTIIEIASPLRTPFTGFFAERLSPPLTAGDGVPIFLPTIIEIPSLLRTPFTGFFAERLGPPIDGG